jgi:hypothetical protein
MRKPRLIASGFVVCIRNTGYGASLERHKIYRVVADAAAAADGDIRVIDESGEDYLYPSSYFAPIKVPAAVEKSLLQPAPSV